jgi:hypothetical protein
MLLRAPRKRAANPKYADLGDDGLRSHRPKSTAKRRQVDGGDNTSGVVPVSRLSKSSSAAKRPAAAKPAAAKPAAKKQKVKTAEQKKFAEDERKRRAEVKARPCARRARHDCRGDATREDGSRGHLGALCRNRAADRFDAAPAAALPAFGHRTTVGRTGSPASSPQNS